MNKHSFRSRFMRFATAVAVGGSAFQLSGCDPNVRTTLLGGLESTTQSLSTALISALFLSLDNNNSTDLTTV